MHSACLPFPDLTPPDQSGDAIPFDGFALAEANHRIANHLALLTGYVRLKSAEVDRLGEPPSLSAVHVLLDGVGAQIAAIARLHRTLASQNPAPSTDLGAVLREICAPFAGGLGGPSRIVEDLPPGCTVRSEQLLPLSQIAAEVITNALKHSGDGAAPGMVLVRCRSLMGGLVRLEIIDRGGGLPAGFDPERDGGVGFRLVRALSQTLAARIEFESTPAGVSFRLTLPSSISSPGRTRHENKYSESTQ